MTVTSSMGATISASAGEDESGYSMRPCDRLNLSDGCHHYNAKHEVPWDVQKYFSQRYSIFSLYDEGICMTDDAWFGVTPEPIANQIANDMYETDAKKTTLIDLFAGAGGNTIAFALSERWERIIAIEKDAATLACAQNNAEVYGVDPSAIMWIYGDSLEFLDLLSSHPDRLHPDLRAAPESTVLFASPPWGGPGYSTDEIFNLNTMQPYGLQQLHAACGNMEHALFLPRTSDLRQIAKLAPEDEKIEVVQYCMEGASKAMTAYIPAKTAKRAA